jgi:ketosteroid isomerase-like protein
MKEGTDMRKLLAVVLVLGVVMPVLAADDEGARVRQTMVDFFAAWSEGDVARYRSLCAQEYLLVEDGEIWDYERDVAQLAKRQADYKRTDHFEFRHTFLRGDTAYVVYELTSEIFEGGRTRHRKWLESAVLVRHDGRWQVALLHSTPYKPSAAE